MRPPLSDLCLTRQREIPKEKMSISISLHALGYHYTQLTTRHTLITTLLLSLHACALTTRAAKMGASGKLFFSIHCTLIYALHAAYTSGWPLKGVPLHAGLTARCTAHSLHAQIHYTLTTHSLHVYFSLHAGDHYTRG